MLFQIKTFLDLCFQSFRSQINVATIQTMTKTLLPWVEQLDYEVILAFFSYLYFYFNP